ncbi:MAG TPA: NAD(P)H-hydrate dehydratase [Gemmatimonadaceae bacterium]|nr:NAD(P)H-hydrate dehydratase [Gemmatimonadaceae bacterium]
MRATRERPVSASDAAAGDGALAAIAPAVHVTTAAQSAARDRAAIDGGVPSRALMGRAGAAAAGEIARRYADLLPFGVAVFAGPGNNGGDAWVVAAALAAAGVAVRVAEAVEPRTADAAAERAIAAPLLSLGEPHGAERLVVDGLLGTGATGDPRGAVADAIRRVVEMRERGATVVALDVPSGLDATTGRLGAPAVTADLTLTFGTLKRGLLAARDAAGAIAVLDIGLGAHAHVDDGAPPLVDARWVAARVPAFAASAHKGTRKRVMIVGGREGMAGATVLAARGAFRSGVGLVRVMVAPASVAAAQAALPEAIALQWPDGDATAPDVDAALIGPGLGRGDESRRLVEQIARSSSIPLVVDADALNDFEGDAAALGALLAGRAAVVTPHPAEAARLVGSTAAEVNQARYDVALALARQLGACVLLKGVPTVIAAPDGRIAVSAAGTPALAVAGSGDLLGGVVVTLLAQTGDAFAAATCGAWAHGRAGELATLRRRSRGVTLDDVTARIGDVWKREAPPLYPVLAELPAVGEGHA